MNQIAHAAPPNSPAPVSVAFSPVFNPVGEVEWIDGVPGERMAVILHNSQVGGRYAVMLTELAPGTATALHYHREDEIFHILEGVLTIEYAGTLVEVEAGGTLVAPAHVEHRWRNRSSAQVRMMTTFSPGGVEDLLTQLKGLTPAEIGALAAQYGTIVTGPPLT